MLLNIVKIIVVVMGIIIADGMVEGSKHVVKEYHSEELR